MSKRLWLGFVAAVILWAVVCRSEAESGPLIIQPLPYPRPGYVVVAEGPRESLEVPFDFADQMQAVFACESEWTPGAVNPTSGARGIPQIHPIHFPRLRSLGLDPAKEGDLMRFAVIKWQEEGLRPWEASKECWKGA